MAKAPADVAACVHQDWRDWWCYDIAADDWLCPCGARQSLQTKAWTRDEGELDKRPLIHNKNRTNR